MTLAERKPRFTARMQGGSVRSWRNLRKLLTAYRQGADTREAAGVAGIGLRTVDDWLQRGSSGEQPYVRFYAIVERIRSVHVLQGISAISASRARNPELAIKWIQIDPRTRDRYGTRVETDADTASVQVLASLAALLAARVAASEVQAPQTPRLLEARDSDATKGTHARE